MKDHEKFKNIKNKYDKYFSEKPGNKVMPKKKKAKKTKKTKKLKQANKIKPSIKVTDKKNNITGPDEKQKSKKLKNNLLKKFIILKILLYIQSTAWAK